MKRLCMAKQKTAETLQIWEKSGRIPEKDHVRLTWLKDTLKAASVTSETSNRYMK